MSERMFFSICQSQYRCDATWYPTQSNFSPVAFIFFPSSSYFLCVFFAFCCGLFLPLVMRRCAKIIAQANVKWLMPHTSFFYAKQMTANIAWRKCTVPKWRFKNSPNHPILFFCFMSESVVPARLFVTRIRTQNQICRMKISVNRMSAVSSPSLDCCLYLWPFVHCQRPPIDVDFCGWYAQSTFTQADSLSWKRTFVDMVICLIYCVIGIRRGNCWPNKADHSFVDVCVRRTSTYTQRAISAISRNEKQCY